MTIIVAGTARLRAGKRERAMEAARAMAEASLEEPGCRAYAFSIDIDDENLAHLFEEWDSEEALTEHFGTPHMAEFAQAVREVLDGEPDFKKYVVESSGPLTG